MATTIIMTVYPSLSYVLDILEKLEYQITIPSAHTILIQYLTAAHVVKKIVTKEQHQPPSQLAAAAVVIARRTVGRNAWSPLEVCLQGRHQAGGMCSVSWKFCLVNRAISREQEKQVADTAALLPHPYYCQTFSMGTGLIKDNGN